MVLCYVLAVTFWGSVAILAVVLMGPFALVEQVWLRLTRPSA